MTHMTFTTAEAADIADIPIWRLQKFLIGKRARLSSGQIGKGKGSRRLFSLADLQQLGLAAHLWRDGFSAVFIGAVIDRFQKDPYLALQQNLMFTRKNETEPYYVLPLEKILAYTEAAAALELLRRSER